MVSDARVLMSEGVGFAAICSNDAASYPEDSFENMKRFAKAHDFPFPYLHDETQTVARAYGAVCTPDFFGYNADRKLKYRGRLDEGRTTPPRAGAPRELVEAMRAIAITGVAPADQKASVGCSIKMEGRIKRAMSTCACRKSNTYIQMMETAKKWCRQNVTNGMYCSRQRRVLVD